jgi:hypothetical protein
MTDTPDNIAREVLARAALVHKFDPLALIPKEVDPATEAKVLALIAQHATEVEYADPKHPEQVRTLWRLNPTTRRVQLARLVAENRLGDVLKQITPLNGDVFAGYLRDALNEKLKPDAVPEADRDSAAIAADYAAEARGKAGTAARQAAASLRSLLSRQVELLRSNAILRGKLIGRTVEQAAINSYIESGVVPEADRLPDPAKPAIVVRPYLLTGTPGAGKSALVADFVRHRRGYPILDEVSRWLPRLTNSVGTLLSKAVAATSAATAAVGLTQIKPQMLRYEPVVLLDFDRQEIALGGEFEWTAEATRQLGLSRPELEKALGDMRREIRRRPTTDVDTKGATAAAAAAGDIKTGMATVFGQQGLTGATLVVVLDTFEEVLVRSSFASDQQIEGSLFGRLLMWADSLATLKAGETAVFSAVRVLVSGREKPDLEGDRLARWFIAHRVVGELDPESAVEFLRRHDSKRNFAGDRARAAVDAIGGHPLTLMLLELYARNLKPEEIDETIRDRKIGRIMGSEAATQSLYSRFLHRFHHDLQLGDGVTAEMVQAVAHPGLVLREITPDLLREVVCPACGLESVDPKTAQALFERLRGQVWLVENVPGRNAIRHRADVRRLMLPMMVGDPDDAAASERVREKMLKVHRNAAAWYDAPEHANDNGALNALYHRAFLPDNSFQDAIAALSPDAGASLARRVADFAGEDLRVMPLAARALLRFHSVGPLRLSNVEVDALPVSLKQKALIERQDASRRQVSNIQSETPVERDVPRETRTLESQEAQAPANEAPESPPAPSGNLSSERFYDLVNDRDLAVRVGYAFAACDFEGAANTCWKAIGELSAFPDLTAPIRFAEDPVLHWVWQGALAQLASGSRGATDEWLDQCLKRLFASVDVQRAGFDSTGMVFAAATTMALNDRRPVGAFWANESRIQVLARIRTIRTHYDLRLLSIFLRSCRTPPGFVTGAGGFMMPFNFSIQVPLNRIQLFARYPRDAFVQMLPEFKEVAEFVESAQREKISSAEADRLVTESKHSVVLSKESLSGLDGLTVLDQLLVGVTPELYDVSVRALIGLDSTVDGAADQAIEAISKDAPFWPGDLEPRDVPSRDRDRRGALLARVVVHADRCGLLVPLLDHASANGQGGAQLTRLAQLARRYEDLRRFSSGPGGSIPA